MIECGLNYPGQIDQEVANDFPPQTGDLVPPFTYPASVFIQFNYLSFVHVGDQEFETYYYSTCNGVLINRHFVLTAANCIVQSYQFYINAINQTLTVPVVLNEAYPDYEQMYNIYIGFDNYISYYIDVWPVQQLALEDIIIVCLKFILLQVTFTILTDNTGLI